jgi:hypothetical protein
VLQRPRAKVLKVGAGANATRTRRQHPPPELAQLVRRVVFGRIVRWDVFVPIDFVIVFNHASISEFMFSGGTVWWREYAILRLRLLRSCWRSQEFCIRRRYLHCDCEDAPTLRVASRMGSLVGPSPSFSKAAMLDPCSGHSWPVPLTGQGWKMGFHIRLYFYSIDQWICLFE